jgi:dienelactone hydrolase
VGCGNESADAPGVGGTGNVPSTGGTAHGGVSGSGASGGAASNGGTSSNVGGTGLTGTGGTSGAAGGSTGTGAAGGATSGGMGAGDGGRSGMGGTDATAGSPAMGGRRGGAGGMAGAVAEAGAGASGAPPAAGAGNTAGTGSGGSGTCTASKAAGSNVSGSGPHKVTVETNADAGISEGTIYRPTDLGGAEKYPIFVWGEGGCSQNGLSNSAAMGEIASHGYFVIADGKPNGSGSRSQTSDVVGMAKPLVAYIDWAVAENGKSCSAYYQALDTTKIASNGFSCGGLMAEGVAPDPRLTTWGINSSGMFSVNQAFYDKVHTPVLIVLGGSDDVAYENGLRDYDNIAKAGHPVMLFSKALGHGGDLFGKNGGDFTKIDVAWLNWWLKGDETATGKGVLVGSGCSYCSDNAWEKKSANLP